MAANTLGRYHIIRELARSNDIVYEAMDPALGRKIALKELQVAPNLTGMARHDRIQRFTREARAAAGLHHRNIVRIHEHGQADGRYFIAMEFLEGQSLRDVLRQRGVLPAPEALRIAADVADALEYAHRHGVVHRDVKPDNVHLEPDGRVVITDFGIARLTFEPSLTADGQIFGTPSYMSPEQVKGGDLDKRSDIFSLGVMLYEMLSGRKPFTGDSVITITYNIMNAEPPPLTGPQGVDAIIRCALAKDMRYRYPSAAQMAEDLRSLAQGQPARRALAISPPGSGVRVGTAASLGAPVPVSRGPLPRHAAPVGAPAIQPGPAGAGVPVSPRPFGTNGGSLPRGAVPRPAAPAPVTPAGYVAAAPRRASRSNSTLGWLLAWAGVAAVIGLLILVLVWSFVTAYDRSRQAQASVRITQIRQAADRSFKEKRYEEALNSYRSVAEQSTGREQAVARRNAAVSANALAVERMNAGNFDDAEQYCQQALLQDPNTLEAYVTLGSIAHRRGRVDDAVAEYDKAIARGPEAELAGLDRKIVEEQVKLAGEFKAQVLLQEGRRLVAEGNAQQAEFRFRGAAGAAPNSKAGQEALDELTKLGASPSAPPSDPAFGADPGTGPAGVPGSAPAPGTAAGGGGQPLPPPANVPFPPAGGGGAPDRPPGWDDSYKKVFGR